MNKNIYSQCVYDVDNRYVDMHIRTLNEDKAFMLTLTDTSNNKESDSEIELYLTTEDLKLIIDRLTSEIEDADRRNCVEELKKHFRVENEKN
jgi:hypothetical protein